MIVIRDVNCLLLGTLTNRSDIDELLVCLTTGTIVDDEGKYHGYKSNWTHQVEIADDCWLYDTSSGDFARLTVPPKPVWQISGSPKLVWQISGEAKGKLEAMLAKTEQLHSVQGNRVRPIDVLSDKSVEQLLDLLESPDAFMRSQVAFMLGFRYRCHKRRVLINPPTSKPQVPEFPVPAKTIPRLVEHLRSDLNSGVRIESMRALRDLRCCANTTALVAAGLEDSNALVRIWTCSALIDIAQEYSEPLVATVLPTLRECLLVDGEVEPTWIAAWITGSLGKAGQPLLPELQRLADHPSPKVRHYANEAMAKTQKK